MKHLLLLPFALSLSLVALSQTDSDIRKLNANRQFLATTDLANPYIDTPPFYPGGGEKWNKYVLGSPLIKDAIEKASAQNMKLGYYSLIVKFAVNADSTITDVKAVNQPLGYGLEEAAVEMVKKSGKWIPANISGVNTKAYLKLPVNITINPPEEQR